MIRKILVLILCVLFIAIGINGVYSFFYPGGNNIQIGDDKKEGRQLIGHINIAFMGIDERSDDEGRTDTLFVIMYNPEKDQTAMFSIPRDTRVRIPNHGWDKINHAYNYGGALSTVNTLERFLGINIDYYVKVDLKGFKKMINAIDGIEIDVEKRMYYEDPWDDDDGLVIDLQPGVQVLDGQQAMEYVRYRDEDGDIGRVKRQQKFINAVYEKMLSPSMVVKIPSLVQVAFDSVDTNMNIMDMLKVANSLQKNNKASLNAYSVPGEPIYIRDISYWFPDVVSTRTQVAEIMGLSKSKGFMNSSKILAQVYEDSLPYDVEREGFAYTTDSTEINKEEKKDSVGSSKKDLIEGLDSEGNAIDNDKLELEKEPIESREQEQLNQDGKIDKTSIQNDFKINNNIKSVDDLIKNVQAKAFVFKEDFLLKIADYKKVWQNFNFGFLSF